LFSGAAFGCGGGWAWPTMNNRKVKVSVVAKFLTKVDLDDKTNCICSAGYTKTANGAKNTVNSVKWSAKKYER